MLEEDKVLQTPKNATIGNAAKMMLRMLLVLMDTYQSCIWQIWRNNMQFGGLIIAIHQHGFFLGEKQLAHRPFSKSDNVMHNMP